MPRSIVQEIRDFLKEFDSLVPESEDLPLSRTELALFTYRYTQDRLAGNVVQFNYFNGFIHMGSAMDNGDRSVTAGGNISGSIIQTGDHNQATLHAVQLPPAESVDIRAAVAELKAELTKLDLPDRGKLDRALADAEDEAKPEGDKQELAGGLTRALGYAKKASDFSERAGKVVELVTRIGGWIGAASPYVAPLLASVGLSAG